MGRRMTRVGVDAPPRRRSAGVAACCLSSVRADVAVRRASIYLRVSGGMDHDVAGLE